jgi:hypothetical protein
VSARILHVLRSVAAIHMLRMVGAATNFVCNSVAIPVLSRAFGIIIAQRIFLVRFAVTELCVSYLQCFDFFLVVDACQQNRKA